MSRAAQTVLHCCVPVSAPRMFMFHRYFLLLAEVVCPYDPDCFVALGSRVNCLGVSIPTTARTPMTPMQLNPCDCLSPCLVVMLLAVTLKFPSFSSIP